MAVRSYPMPDPPKDAPPRAVGGFDLFIGRLGMWLAVIAFGGVFWAINGGFSVIGLGVLANSFNDSGRLFWAAASSIQFAVPVRVPGLPATQPLIPWLGVIASSCLQVSIIWRKLSGRPIPLWLWVAATASSFYDYGTTFFGLSTIGWIAALGPYVQAVLAVPVTFFLEVMIGYALRGGKK
jgi:hypothetical protein